jgi:AcrR family transcriptional regulator
MTLEPSPPKAYRNHRENQRERILEVAERLFISSGIDQVSLSDIARAARMTRNTVYEYFPNKQELAWVILVKIFEQGRVGTGEQPAGTGFQRLEYFMLGMVGRLETQSEHMRFIVEFNSLYAREASADRMRQATGRTASGADNPVARLICQGIADGSIRPDLDPDLLSAAIWNLLSGMNSRFAQLGDRISEEYAQPVTAIYQEICRVFLRGIQSTLNPQETPG